MWCRSSAASGSSEAAAGQEIGDEVSSPSTSGGTSVPASRDASASRPVAPATSSGFSWRGLKVPKNLVVKRARM